MGSSQGIIDVSYLYLGITEDDPRFTELIEFYNVNTVPRYSGQMHNAYWPYSV